MFEYVIIPDVWMIILMLPLGLGKNDLINKVSVSEVYVS